MNNFKTNIEDVKDNDVDQMSVYSNKQSDHEEYDGEIKIDDQGDFDSNPENLTLFEIFLISKYILKSKNISNAFKKNDNCGKKSNQHYLQHYFLKLL